jgi:hypothetical protein
MHIEFMTAIDNHSRMPKAGTTSLGKMAASESVAG